MGKVGWHNRMVVLGTRLTGEMQEDNEPYFQGIRNVM